MSAITPENVDLVSPHSTRELVRAGAAQLTTLQMLEAGSLATRFATALDGDDFAGLLPMRP